MRTPLPASCRAFRLNLSLFDVSWVFLSPLFALYLSNAYVLSARAFLAPDDFKIVALFCLFSAFSSVLGFLIFRFQDGVPSYFSVPDAIEIAKAVVAAELITCLALFSLTRLEGIPRAALIIHALILAAGLVASRFLVRLKSDKAQVSSQKDPSTEHVIVIGSNRLSSLYIKLLKTCVPRLRRVVGILDNRPEMVGRMLEGIRIVGTPRHLGNLIDEYSVHGVRIDRVIIGGSQNLVSEEMGLIRSTCTNRQIKIDFIPELVGLTEVNPGCWATKGAALAEKIEKTSEDIIPSRYFFYKPIIDSFAAFVMLLVLIPLILIVSLMVLVDTGRPILFWQQRIGRNGRNFLLYKFRTLQPPFDHQGREIPNDQRLSFVGDLLRNSALDELPQLLNVLVGEMSLIGPRPLLPEDQPADSSGRLLVRPGITGWAQVNGGKWLTVEEKVELDLWYIQNASFLVDLIIVWRTLRFIGFGARRANKEVVGDDRNGALEHWQKSSAA
jgi:lipopolysaccharide/colanic/teichoic acid biosynthesis glycosyltransferase